MGSCEHGDEPYVDPHMAGNNLICPRMTTQYGKEYGIILNLADGVLYLTI
jgi:hypothetical protein